MTDFLLELRSEEIPARMQDKARADLQSLFEAQLAKAGLKAAQILTFATPRRLAMIARDLPVETQAVSEELKGPKTSAPAQALEGFLRKTGLTQDQLVDRDGTWFAVIEKPGRTTADVLAEAIPAIIRDFSWPKSMRWGAASLSSESQRWVRPLQGIVALLGDEVVPLAIDGVKSGAETLGHRFHHPGAVTIGNAGDYAAKLKACHVIVDQEERKALIRTGAAKAAEKAGLVLVEDEGLVAENAGLTEWPVPMLGRFDPAFLQVPEEVIQLTARVNQKYFICRDRAGKLANAFVCTANITAHDGGAAIVAGNEKVLAARLSDAKFFWEQDLKVPLERQAEKLSQIVFHEKLGTVADKVDRVAKLARWLVEEGVVKGASADDAERAARLAKADLVTGMVGEFPELQGIMGGYYARAQGENDAVADAVAKHYGVDCHRPIEVALSLADKFDTINSFFSIGEKPTGSKDPFAIRRAGLGVIFLVLSRVLRLDLDRIAGSEVVEFLIERWKYQNRSAGSRTDYIDAVVSLRANSDLYRLGALMRALEAFVSTDDGINLLAGYKRAANILKQAGEADAAAPRHAALEAEEGALLAALEAAEPKAAAAVEAEDFEGAMAALASLRSPIDAFFEGVMVNDTDPQKRAFRLGLLARFRDAVHRVADFSKIEG